ncbi:hypothetical protein D1610_01485 [Sphingomonas gilva]|uniref:Uncharacterized protein n=1 Tax=Sphingomonas gilva TaxID=2305907 RepID=A0A396RR36_9SPHN|nr:hypothetical protein [Sphingomonas gilva]RHW18849.1 hypothetical protein D1610_01485 [Sphingomonas gilva]
MKRIRQTTAAAIGAAIMMTWSAVPAHAEDDACAVAAKPKKKRGLGGLFSAVRSSGLEGSIAGTLRGDGDLKSDLTGSARAAAERGLARAACADSATVTEGSSEASGDEGAARAAPISATERARREMAAADAKYPSRMPIPPEWQAAKEAYDEFGKVVCFGCEGGHAYSGWPDWPRDEFSGKYGGDEKRLSRFPIGHVHRWSANGFAGSLTIAGEETVNGFRCRKLRYRLEKAGKSAERPGLICWGKANEYAGSDSWVGVF